MNPRITILLLSIFCILSVKSQSNNNVDSYIRKQDSLLQEFIDEKEKEFQEFRNRKNEEFAQFLENAGWESFVKKKGLEKPIEKDIPPVVYDEKNDKRNRYKEHNIKIVEYDRNTPPQPKPIVPIRQNELTRDYNTFLFYGTKMNVRWGDLSSFKLSKCDEKSLATAYRKLTNVRYNNLLSDCLSLRDNYALCDWAYYKMLEAMAAAVCGKGTNEAIFLHGVLFQQSGYAIRFATNSEFDHLYLLSSIKGISYDTDYIIIENKKFYLFGDNKNNNFQICKMAYSGEKDMSMDISSLPRFEFNLTDIRTIKSESYNISVNTAVNKNLIDFMNDYPTTRLEDNKLTRWTYYANAPISEEVKQLVYPQLKERLKNVTPLTSVNMLLNWVQTGFEYEYDNIVWEQDRAFFAEETLYYPFSDCEDRAILFSHLVRDLVGLDVVLVYYPGHLATAVCFNDNKVDGDYLMLDERKFIIADPCYRRARVGCTMPDMDNKVAEIILCKR